MSRTREYPLPSVHAVRTLEALGWSALLVWIGAFVSLGYPWTMVGVYTDGLSYLSIADAIHRGIGDPASVAGLHALRGGRFPPGYPAYLSLFGAGVDAVGMRAANLAQMTAVLLMAAGVFGFLRCRTGSRRSALLGLLYVLSLPFIQPWSLELISEPLFVAIMLAACWVAASGAIAPRWFWVAALLGLACLVRMLGIALLPVLVLWVWRRERSIMRALVAGIIASAPIMAWLAFQWQAGLQTQATYVGEFEAATRAQSPLSLATLAANLAGLGAALSPRYLSSLPAAVLVAILVLTAAIRLAEPGRRFELATLFLGSLLVVLMLWPYPEHQPRLAGPVAPLVAGLALAPGERAERARVLQTVLRCLLWVGIGVGFLCGTHRMIQARFEIADPELRVYSRNVVVHNRRNPMREVENYHRILLAAEQAASIIGRGACMSTTLPSLVRLRAPTQVRAVPRPFAWERNGCDYVLAINASFLGTPALYPLHEPGLTHETVLVSRFPDGPFAAVLMRRPTRAATSASEPGDRPEDAQAREHRLR